MHDSPTTDIPYRNTLLLSPRTSDGLGHSLGQCVFIWYGKNVMVTIPLLLDHVADFVWRHRWDSNPPGTDRQSVALPEDYYGKTW